MSVRFLKNTHELGWVVEPSGDATTSKLLEFLNTIATSHRPFELRTELAYTRRVWSAIAGEDGKRSLFWHVRDQEPSVVDALNALERLLSLFMASRRQTPSLDRLRVWLCNAITNLVAKRPAVGTMSFREFEDLFFGANTTSHRFHDTLSVEDQITGALSSLCGLLELAEPFAGDESGARLKANVVHKIFRFPHEVVDGFGAGSWSPANKRCFLRVYVSVYPLHGKRDFFSVAKMTPDETAALFITTPRSALPLHINVPAALALQWPANVAETLGLAEKMVDAYDDPARVDNVFLWILKLFCADLVRFDASSSPSSDSAGSQIQILWRNAVLATAQQANSADDGVVEHVTMALVYAMLSRRSQPVFRHKQLKHCMYYVCHLRATYRSDARGRVRDRLFDAAVLEICSVLRARVEQFGIDLGEFASECQRFGCAPISSLLIQGGLVARGRDPLDVAAASAAKQAKKTRRKERKKAARAAKVAAEAAEAAAEDDKASDSDEEILELDALVVADEADEPASAAALPTPSTPPTPPLKAADECVVCLDALAERRTLVLCCGIARVCQACGPKLTSCPFCREEKEDFRVLSVVV